MDPERLAKCAANGKSFGEKKHHTPPTPYHLVQSDSFEGCSKDKPIFIEVGSERPSRLPKPIDSSHNAMHQTAFLSPNSPLFLKGGVPGNSRVEFKKRPRLDSGDSCAYREGSEFVKSVQNKSGNGDFISTDSITSPPARRQKRLVRNGCISPNNIAKAKQSVVKDTCDFLPSDNITDSIASSSPSALVSISDLVAEVDDPHKRKGKGILTEPCSYREPEHRNKNLHIRSSINCDEKAVGGDFIEVAGKSTGESGGWRTTRNGNREMDMLSSTVVRETGEARCSNRHLGDKTERRGKGLDLFSGNDYSENPHPISPVSACPNEPVSRPKAHLGRPNGHSSTANTHIKRKKQGSTSRNVGDCSTSVSDDFEVVVLNSTAQAAGNPKSTYSGMDSIQTNIEVNELSPLSRCNAHNEDAKARQVEADELLARELQEQFYNDAPVHGFGEMDEYLARALQHHDVQDQGAPRARQPRSRARGSFVSELRRQSQSRTSSSSPRRGSRARASTSGRMTRVRSSFPGQSRTISSRGRTSMFPSDMDIDERMHILGALEEFSDMRLAPGILQTRRDFNEDDYEMLLALDENNNVHSGASNSQINGLPQSTVQNDKFEETCAICLETPAIGDTIRHLPCLHKFHKDCIDPWLRRKTSCPVCKSSIA